MKTPAWWEQRCITANACRPLASVWEAGAWLRQKISVPERMPVPVVCIGNVVAGGGGKTPVALALGREAKNRGINAFFLSRGYGGVITKPTFVNLGIHTATDVGDEPLLLARVLPTIVAKNRVHGAGLAVAQGATLIIMDDGLQYPNLHKDMSLLVMKGARPVGNGLMIPAGPMREPLEAALERSDAVIHVDGENTSLPDSILQSGKPVWGLDTTLTFTPPIHNHQSLISLIAFTGIARPEHFRKSLEQAGLHIAGFYGFADHHPYTPQELNALMQSADAAGLPLITTEKDWVRIAPHVPANPRLTEILLAKQQLTLPPDTVKLLLGL